MSYTENSFSQKDFAIRTKILESIKSREFDPKYYDPSWLAFLYLGLPSSAVADGSEGCCETLKSGVATTNMHRNDAVMAQRRPSTDVIKERGANPDRTVQ